jgi:hypothetical protein
MVTVQKFKVISDKFNIDRICTSLLSSSQEEEIVVVVICNVFDY